MLTWPEQQDDVTEAVLDSAAFGELVSLPGPIEVYGIFNPDPRVSEGRWTGEAGPGAGIDSPAPPTLWMDGEDANVQALETKDVLTIRSRDWSIVRIDRSDPQMTRFTLRPAT